MMQDMSLHNTFIQIELGQQDFLLKKDIESISESDLSVTILDWPSRSLEYITIPKLTFIGEPYSFFLLGCILINKANCVLPFAHLFSHLNTIRCEKSKISSLLVDIWRARELAIDASFSGDQKIYLNRNFPWLSPLKNHELSEVDQPIAGLLNENSRAFSDFGVKLEGSAAYLGSSAEGAIALGKTLLLFATEQGESIQFEQNLDGGGVGRMSYEIECHKVGSFAAESLLL